MTQPDLNPWAAHDAAAAARRVARAEAARAPRRFAFYGRVSTDEVQDVVGSVERQRQSVERHIALVGGELVAEYADRGTSRASGWYQRPEAERLLADLRAPNRAWDAVIVAEVSRAFESGQQDAVLAMLDAAAVQFWTADHGRLDRSNVGHAMQLALATTMSAAERRTTIKRITDGMASQVISEGRFQGGTAPYGYRVVTTDRPHPNPLNASRGVMLRRLEKDDDTAPIVQRIFERTVAGDSLRKIARELERDRVLTPAARRDGYISYAWTASSVRSILDNGRVTGYEWWGKAQKIKADVDPTRPMLGTTTKRVLTRENLVHSREQVHEPIISIALFQQVQDILAGRARRADGRGSRQKSINSAAKRIYLFRGMVTCHVCGRRLEGNTSKGHAFYRCRALRVDGATAHPPHSVNVSEADLSAKVNAWVGLLFGPDAIEDTIAKLSGAASQEHSGLAEAAERLGMELRDATKRRDNLLDLMERNGHSDAINDRFLRADGEVQSIQRQLADTAAVRPVGAEAEVRELVLRLAPMVEKVLSSADAARLHELYRALGVRVSVGAVERGLVLSALPVGALAAVREVQPDAPST